MQPPPPAQFVLASAIPQVNHLAPFYLTELLLPNLRKAHRETGDPSRVVLVASGAHRWAKTNGKGPVSQPATASAFPVRWQGTEKNETATPFVVRLACTAQREQLKRQLRLCAQAACAGDSVAITTGLDTPRFLPPAHA